VPPGPQRSRRRRLACLLFGTSLAIKHVAILVAPLYLGWTWHGAEQDAPRRERWLSVGATSLWIALISLAVSLPFLWWDPGAFVRSL
jgi:uncharacterized membrane protein